LTPRKFGDDFCPAANPGAWPEEGPASHEPQPGALVDACSGQLAVNAVPAGGGGAGVGGGATGAVVAGEDGAAALDGATAGRVFLGLALARFEWCFLAIGAEVPTVGAVRLGVVAKFGEVLPGAGAFPQPAAIAMSGRRAKAPMTMRVILRLRLSP
jgi:hypothetical protein